MRAYDSHAGRRTGAAKAKGGHDGSGREHSQTRQSVVEELTVDELRAHAEQLALAGNWGNETLTVNQQLVVRVPGDSDAWTRLARCWHERSEETLALECYIRAVALDPGNTVAKNALARLSPPKPRDNVSGYTRHESDDGRFSNCFACGNAINNIDYPECESCGWIICDCGACGCSYWD